MQLIETNAFHVASMYLHLTVSLLFPLALLQVCAVGAEPGVGVAQAPSAEQRLCTPRGLGKGCPPNPLT